jgi:hypothetical protein
MFCLDLQKESYLSSDISDIGTFLEDSSGKSCTHLAPYKCVSLVYCFNKLW